MKTFLTITFIATRINTNFAKVHSETTSTVCSVKISLKQYVWQQRMCVSIGSLKNKL